MRCKIAATRSQLQKMHGPPPERFIERVQDPGCLFGIVVRMGEQGPPSGKIGVELRRSRLAHGERVAAALANIVVEGRDGPWSIVGTNTGEGGHAREHHHPWRSRLVVLAPDSGGAAVTGFKHDHRTAGAPALQVQSAAIPDVNEAREITLRGVRHWRGGAQHAEGDGKQKDGDGQGSEPHDCCAADKRVEVPASHLRPSSEGFAGLDTLPHRGQAACGLDHCSPIIEFLGQRCSPRSGSNSVVPQPSNAE